MSYHIGSQNIVAIPIYVRHNISFREAGGGRLDITVGPKQTIGRTVSTESTILYFYFLFTLLCPAYLKELSYETCSLL
jgi:hypothetical protein